MPLHCHAFLTDALDYYYLVNCKGAVSVYVAYAWATKMRRGLRYSENVFSLLLTFAFGFGDMYVSFFTLAFKVFGKVPAGTRWLSITWVRLTLVLLCIKKRDTDTIEYDYIFLSSLDYWGGAISRVFAGACETSSSEFAKFRSLRVCVVRLGGSKGTVCISNVIIMIIGSHSLLSMRVSQRAR